MTSDASAAGRVGPRFLLRPRLLGLVNTWKGGTRAEKWTYAFFIGVGALFWVGLFVGLYIGLDAFRSVEVFGPLITRKLLELLLLSLFGMLLFSNVVTALSAFYLSDDLELLLSMPIRRDVFYYTRALDTLGQSSWMMAFFGVPLFVDYGLVCDASWRYYALLPVVMGAYLAIPAAIGAVVSSILVTFFPAHRTREALVIIGLMFLMAVLDPRAGARARAPRQRPRLRLFGGLRRRASGAHTRPVPAALGRGGAGGRGHRAPLALAAARPARERRLRGLGGLALGDDAPVRRWLDPLPRGPGGPLRPGGAL
jgi:hypothetical protein